MKVPIHSDYPVELSIEDADKFAHFKGFEDEIEAIKYSKKTTGQMYTQVDCDCEYDESKGMDNTVAYLRGHHVVNRTGYWIVVKR